MVTVDKQPLPEGLITFVPLASTAGQKTSTHILDGRYSIEHAEGLVPGEYRVEIFGMPPGVRALAEGKTPEHSSSNFREIAPEFNRRSRLMWTIDQEKRTTADFEVRYESKPNR